MPRSVLVGRRRLFPEDAVEDWLQAQEARQTTASAEAPEVTPEAPKPRGRPRRPASASSPNRESRHRKTRSTKRGKQSPAQIGLFGRELE
jgi:hypothetical protein